jgi:hypothetical protein
MYVIFSTFAGKYSPSPRLHFSKKLSAAVIALLHYLAFVVSRTAVAPQPTTMAEWLLRDWMHASFPIEPTEQNVPTMPTLWEEQASRTALSPTAIAFIADYTTTPTNVSAADECPVCLETYSANKPCVQIKGLGSCAHRFCRSCVSVLVTRRTNADIKCTICRTVWIAGARTLERAGTNNTPNQAGNSRLQRQEFSAATQPFVPGQPVVIDLSNETESYDTQVQNFHQATRAIEDVRARARHTQLSRSERRQEMRDETARRRAAEREGRHRSNAVLPMARAFGTPRGGKRAEAQHDQRPRTEQQPTATNPFNLPLPATSANLHLVFDSPRSPAASSSATAPASEPATRPRETIESITSGISLEDQRRQTLADCAVALGDRNSELIRRTTELNLRATAQNTRDTELNNRENSLNERLTIMLQRERDVVAREEVANAKARLMQKHRGEMEKLIKKQKEEMDRLR